MPGLILEFSIPYHMEIFLEGHCFTIQSGALALSTASFQRVQDLFQPVQNENSLSRVFSLCKCILSCAIKFLYVRSSQGNFNPFEFIRAFLLSSRKSQTLFMVYENLRFSDCSFPPVTIFKTEISGFFILNTGQIWDNLASENRQKVNSLTPKII